MKEKLQAILEELKNPVTTIVEKSKTEDLKKGCIKGAILALIMSVVGILSTVTSIISKYSSKSVWYKNYSSAELWEKRWDAIGDAELFTTFIRSFVIYAVCIAIFALILFIIAKLVKKSKDYSATLSMVNTTLSVYVIAMILNLILSAIYAPLGLLVLYATMTYASFGLMSAFRISLELEDTNKLVLVSTAVLTVTVAIIYILIFAVLGNALSELNSLESLLK